MKNKKNKWLILIIALVAIIAGIVAVCSFTQKKTELRSIKSEKELENWYSGSSYSTNTGLEKVLRIIGAPIYIVSGAIDQISYGGRIIPQMDLDYAISKGTTDIAVRNTTEAISESITSGKDYSTTNIQVENVDEADIIKTDGDYIYSISQSNVVITDARETKNLKIASKISVKGIPEDLIIYNNKLVVISAETTSGIYYYYNNNNNTTVSIYDIADKENPKILKTYTMYEPYYTSRCIDNKLYVISSGYLRKENDKIITYYTEDRAQKDMALENIKYLTDIKTRKQTLISFVDLNNAKEDVKLNSYLIDISNAYVSENAIYLLNEKYEGGYGSVPPLSSLYGIKGALGPFLWEREEKEYGYYTDIYKFSILENGEIEYKAKANVRGQTINQYSLDEYENNLRVALYTYQDGSRVVVFDENLREIGASDYLAKGEKMYSSRFIGNKAYLVTYKNMDPLFVIDLSNPLQPKVLGELKIPGYSTYLHPYDENHLIGIGMETKEEVYRDAYGRVTNTTARIVGMKMALFDVSDVENPKEISNVVIGDSRTTSSILTNPKALLFSREKGLIAIPVNNYKDDFEVLSSDSIDTAIDYYVQRSKDYISEGYFVYDINLTDGFSLKGTVTHENTEKTYGYGYNSKLLRGLYIDNNLFTISENEIKVNKLDTMEEISNLKINDIKQNASNSIV